MRLAVAVLATLALLASGCSGSSRDPATGDDDGALAATGNQTAMLPEVTHFEFGPALGCASDAYTVSGGAVPLNCVSFQGGPDRSGIDGHWLALDETYWGLQLTSTIAQSPTGPQPVPVIGQVLGDSDCVVTDATRAILAEGGNGTGACGLVIPDGTAYLFIWPYGTPATQITVDFVLPA